jgi:hypothetical protein
MDCSLLYLTVEGKEKARRARNILKGKREIENKPRRVVEPLKSVKEVIPLKKFLGFLGFSVFSVVKYHEKPATTETCYVQPRPCSL